MVSLLKAESSKYLGSRIPLNKGSRIMGILGTTAPAESDVNLLLHFAILALILAGFAFARSRKYHIHEKWMFPAIVLAAVSLLTWMAPSYIRNFHLVVSDFYTPGIIITNIHVVLGIITGSLAVYIVLRMKLDLPEKFAIKRVRRLMRTTLVLWLLTFLLGVSFYVWYFLL